MMSNGNRYTPDTLVLDSQPFSWCVISAFGVNAPLSTLPSNSLPEALTRDRDVTHRAGEYDASSCSCSKALEEREMMLLVRLIALRSLTVGRSARRNGLERREYSQYGRLSVSSVLRLRHRVPGRAWYRNV